MPDVLTRNELLMLGDLAYGRRDEVREAGGQAGMWSELCAKLARMADDCVASREQGDTK